MDKYIYRNGLKKKEAELPDPADFFPGDVLHICNSQMTEEKFYVRAVTYDTAKPVWRKISRKSFIDLAAGRVREKL